MFEIYSEKNSLVLEHRLKPLPFSFLFFVDYFYLTLGSQAGRIQRLTSTMRTRRLPALKRAEISFYYLCGKTQTGVGIEVGQDSFVRNIEKKIKTTY